jgi:Tfp pilus assembly protein PilE
MRRRGREEGVGVVEVLAYMLLLGILAAVAIPSYFTQKEKTHDTDAEAEALSAQAALDTYANANDDSFIGADAAALHDIEATIQPRDISISNLTTNGYTVTAISASGNTFSVTRDAVTDDTSQACSDGGEGACPEGGTHW